MAFSSLLVADNQCREDWPESGHVMGPYSPVRLPLNGLMCDYKTAAAQCTQ